MSDNQVTKKRTHWPVILLGVLVAVLFFAVMFVFEVKESEFALLQRFGRPVRDNGEVRVYEPGLHFKWPFVDRVWRHDNRLMPYELTRGQVEQVQTRDDYQIIITTFVFWRVGEPYRFLTSFTSTAEAESKMDEIIRHSRNSVLAEHRLSDLVNVDPDELRLAEVEDKILRDVQEVAMEEYGIEITHLGIKHLGFPEQVTTTVFERMIEERNKRIEEYRSAGTEEAERIKTEADLEAQRLITEAEADATRIRGEGDREAAEQYAVFRKNPELASFLRKLEALRQTLSDKTTLVIDTDTPPYDLLRAGALDLDIAEELEPDLEEEEIDLEDDLVLPELPEIDSRIDSEDER